jgi:hypothetical protein
VTPAVLDVLDRIGAHFGLDPLRNARQPWGVVLHRLRRVPELFAAHHRTQQDRAEAARWAGLDRAARRGETLRALVEHEALFSDEAAAMVEREFTDPELAAVALAAISGRGER